MRANRIWLTLIPVLMALTAGTTLLAANGATTSGGTDTITLELKDVDVRSAIEALFKNSGKNFYIDQNVQGTVSALSFKDVPLDTALKNLTKSTGLVYRVDGGVYVISKRPDVTATMQNAYGSAPAPEVAYVDQPTTSEMQIEKIPLNYTSASEILAVMSGTSGNSMNSYQSMGMGGSYGSSYGGFSPYGNYGGSSYTPYGSYSNYGNYPSYGSYGGYNSGIRNYGGYGSNSYGNYGGYGSNNGYRGW